MVLTIQRNATTYVALETQSLHAALPFGQTDTRTALGMAQFITETWSPRLGRRDLYELRQEEHPIGLGILLEDQTFLPIEEWIEQAKLPPDPQHAMFAAMLYSGMSGLGMVCIAVSPEANGENTEFCFFRKKPDQQIGQWQGPVCDTLSEAIHYLQASQDPELLLPFRISTK